MTEVYVLNDIIELARDEVLIYSNVARCFIWCAIGNVFKDFF